MCLPCHDEYIATNCNPTLKECPGDSCPLGIAHPGPTRDAHIFGVFPLGCGICRSEKLEILENKQFRQVIDESNMPKTYRKSNQKEDKIDRPLVEIEMPLFIADYAADEEAERQAELDRLAKIPVYYLPPVRIRNKELKEKLRLRKLADFEDQLPEWFLNPLGEDDLEESKEGELCEKGAQMASELENQMNDAADEMVKKAALLMQKKKLLKAICGS